MHTRDVLSRSWQCLPNRQLFCWLVLYQWIWYCTGKTIYCRGKIMGIFWHHKPNPAINTLSTHFSTNVIHVSFLRIKLVYGVISWHINKVTDFTSTIKTNSYWNRKWSYCFRKYPWFSPCSKWSYLCSIRSIGTVPASRTIACWVGIAMTLTVHPLCAWLACCYTVLLG
jgi:hypothetical protein